MSETMQKPKGRPPEWPERLQVCKDTPDEFVLVASYAAEGSADSARRRIKMEDWFDARVEKSKAGRRWNVYAAYEGPEGL